MRTRWLAFLASAAVLVLAVSTARGQGDLVLYDDFNGRVIDPDRWIGLDFGFGPTDRREQVREIWGNTLRLASRLWSDPNVAGGQRNGGSALLFANPGAIRAMEAELRVWDVESRSCGFPATTTGRLHGFFFNTGEGAPPEDRTGDVGAEISIFRNSNDPAGMLTVDERVFKCVNAQCSSTTDISFFPVLGTAAIKEKVRLRMTWDEPGNQFIFQLGDDPPVFVNYSGLLGADPIVVGGNKRIEVVNTVQNCVGSRSMAYMDLRADDVRVNP